MVSHPSIHLPNPHAHSSCSREYDTTGMSKLFHIHKWTDYSEATGPKQHMVIKFLSSGNVSVSLRQIQSQEDGVFDDDDDDVVSASGKRGCNQLWPSAEAERLKERLLSSWDWWEDVVSGLLPRALPSNLVKCPRTEAQRFLGPRYDSRCFVWADVSLEFVTSSPSPDCTVQHCDTSGCGHNQLLLSCFQLIDGRVTGNARINLMVQSQAVK